MSKRTRLLAFFFAVLVFVVLSYVMVVYSLGYRYDFVHKRFLPTGSLRVVAGVVADVYINDELVGRTSLLGNTFSKSRMLPRTYSVRLEKTGYHAWQKNIPISGGLFTDFPKILLVPESLIEVPIGSSSFEALSSVSFDAEKKTVLVHDEARWELFDLKTGAIASSSISTTVSSTKKIVVPKNSQAARKNEVTVNRIRQAKDRFAEFNDHEIWVTWTRSTDYQPFRTADYRELVLRIPSKVDDVQWHKDREHLLVASNGILSIMEIDKRGGINSYSIATLEGPFWYDEDSNSMYLFRKNILTSIKLDF